MTINKTKTHTLSANPVEICEDQEEKQETGTPEKGRMFILSANAGCKN